MAAIKPPFEIFYDSAGRPADNAKIYIGTEGQNPETAPVSVYWDEAQTIVAKQPLRTIAGAIYRGGNKAQVYGPSRYSIAVKSANDELYAYSASVSRELSSDDINYGSISVTEALNGAIKTVPNFAALSSTGGFIGDKVYLLGHTVAGLGGGYFIAKSATGLTADGGTVAIFGVLAWVREGGINITPQMFGALGDGVTNDAVAIKATIATGKSIKFPKGTYNFGTTSTRDVLIFTQDNQNIELDGSTLRFLSKSEILVKCNDLTIDLQGGVLTQDIGYAEVAVNTVSGSSTITVVDSSNLKVGQDVASSWGDTAGSGVYPLGGPTAPVKRKVQSISGNVVTLDTPMTPGDYLAAQVVFGDFEFSAFIQGYKNNLIIKNGTLKRVSGYYYHTPNAVGDAALVPGGYVTFENINFESNGCDQLLLKHGQKLKLRNCRMAQQWDTGKSGIYLADTASLYIQDCDELHLGNFDASITVSNIWDSAIDGGEIVISNSTIYGVTRFTSPPAASQAQNNLSFIELSFSGIFDRISLSNSRCVGYLRHNITSTAETRETSTVVSAIRIDNCLIDGSAFYFLYSGSGNGINCPNVRISNTSYYQSFGYAFHYVAGISGAVCNFTPHFDNCFFQFAGSSGGFAEFGSTAHVADSQFNMISVPYTHHQSYAKLDNCLFSGNPVINITPTYSTEFYGDLSRIIIDSPNFPTNLSSVFTALGGSSLAGAKIATAKSQNGSVYYNIFKQGSTIRASADFYISNNIYFLRGDDYYIPIGSTIRDMYLGTTKRVTFNLLSSLTSTAAAGATSIVVSDASGIVVGDLVNIVLDNGLVDTKVVDASYTSGLTIPLTSALSSQASNTKPVNFFRVV